MLTEHDGRPVTSVAVKVGALGKDFDRELRLDPRWLPAGEVGTVVVDVVFGAAEMVPDDPEDPTSFHAVVTARPVGARVALLTGADRHLAADILDAHLTALRARQAQLDQDEEDRQIREAQAAQERAQAEQRKRRRSKGVATLEEPPIGAEVGDGLADQRVDA